MGPDHVPINSLGPRETQTGFLSLKKQKFQGLGVS